MTWNPDYSLCPSNPRTSQNVGHFWQPDPFSRTPNARRRNTRQWPERWICLLCGGTYVFTAGGDVAGLRPPAKREAFLSERTKK